MFFASRSCFQHMCRFQATPLLQIKKGLKSRKVLETATKIKNMKPLWKVKGSEKQTSWKVSVQDCVFFFMRNEQKERRRHVHLYADVSVILRVCDTPQTHTQPHTTKHTNKTPTTHQPTAHPQYTQHTHCTPSKSKHVRTRKMVNCALMRAYVREVSWRY